MNAVSSPIRNPDLLRRSKVYSWSKITQFTPRKIMPTDVEGMIECNSHFLFFEFKTEGAVMPAAQKEAYVKLLKVLGGRGCLFICTHKPLGLKPFTEPIDDVTSVTIWMWQDSDQRLCFTPAIPLEDEDFVGWLVQEWSNYAEGNPGRFIRFFRQRAGLAA